MLQNINLAKIKSRLEEAKTNAMATAERVQQRVMEEKQKKGGVLGSLIEKIGTAVEELAEESGFEESLNAPRPMDLVYVTKQFIAMGFPCDRATLRQRLRQQYQRQKALGNASGIPQLTTSLNDVSAVARHLRKYHQGQYMVLNVSEESYDYSWFEDQVLEFKFPGQPAPPLGMLFKMCASVESWLAADPSNVIAVHCLTGRGRTSVVIACAATWLGLFESTHEALEYVAKRRGETVDKLTIPSQRRYAQYFANVLDGVAPRSEPLVLRRAIMNLAPDFEPIGAGQQYSPGCRPYLQFFKAGKLAYTASWTRPGDELDTDQHKSLATPGDAPLIFNVDCIVHGDLLVRCRHQAADGSRVSMFRAALHVGYAPAGVLRLTKSQLDGACSDPRFPDHFVLDLIFAPLEDAHAASENQDEASTSPATHREEAARADLKTSYDALLHKDSRFWEEVRARKDRALIYREKLKARQQHSTSMDSDTPHNADDTRPDTAEVLKQKSTSVFAIDVDEDASPHNDVSKPDEERNQPQVHTDDLLQQLAEAEQGLHSDDHFENSEEHDLLTPAPPAQIEVEEGPDDILPDIAAAVPPQEDITPTLSYTNEESLALPLTPVESSSLEQSDCPEAAPCPPDEVFSLEESAAVAHSEHLVGTEPQRLEALPLPPEEISSLLSPGKPQTTAAPEPPSQPPPDPVESLLSIHATPLSTPQKHITEKSPVSPAQEPDLLALDTEPEPLREEKTSALGKKQSELDLLGFNDNLSAGASATFRQETSADDLNLLGLTDDIVIPSADHDTQNSTLALDKNPTDTTASPARNDSNEDDAFIDDFESYLNSISTT